MEELVRTIMHLVKSRDHYEQLGKIWDDLSYSHKYLDTRNQLKEMGISVTPMTPIALEVDEGVGKVSVIDSNNDECILALYDEGDAVYTHMDTEELLDLIYTEYWEDIEDWYTGME